MLIPPIVWVVQAGRGAATGSGSNPRPVDKSARAAPSRVDDSTNGRACAQGVSSAGPDRLGRLQHLQKSRFGVIIRCGGALMRVTILLGSFLLATCLFFSASDQPITQPIRSLVGPSGRSGFKALPLLNQGALHASGAAERERRSHSLPSKAIKVVEPGANLCYTMRTYVMVRQDRNSDVTRRDGYLVCQPAWKFEVRTALSTFEDR